MSIDVNKRGIGLNFNADGTCRNKVVGATGKEKSMH